MRKYTYGYISEEGNKAQHNQINCYYIQDVIYSNKSVLAICRMITVKGKRRQ